MDNSDKEVKMGQEDDKDLEDDYGQEVHEIDMIAQFKMREEKMQQDLMQKQAEIDGLKQENMNLIKRGVPKSKGTEGESSTNQYTKFVE